MDPEIEDAVRRARQGDAAAYGAIVRAYGDSLVRFLASVLGGDVHAANDVAQETFLAAWHALPRLREPSLLRAWLYRVGYHKAVSHMRRRAPRGSAFTPFDEDEVVRPPPPPPAWTVDGAPATTEEAGARLRAALRELPPRYAGPVTLFYLQGLGTRETARALGLSRATVKMRLYRARVLLRRWLVPAARIAAPPLAPPLPRRPA